MRDGLLIVCGIAFVVAGSIAKWFTGLDPPLAWKVAMWTSWTVAIGCLAAAVVVSVS